MIMSKSIFAAILICFSMSAYASELSDAITNVHDACRGISEEMYDMKKLAGINTAITGLGTVSGGVAFGTGIAKSNVDKQAEELGKSISDNELNDAKEITTKEELYGVLADLFEETETPEGISLASSLRRKQQELLEKSKKLGNWRTGTMAGATVANIAGTVISGNNRIKGDLQSRINECIAATKTLAMVRMQAYINGDANAVELKRAEEIETACSGWETVDLSKINTKARGATISSAIGASTGVAGTITSGVANSQSVRDGDAQKEKNLNTVSNVLAGATTATSLTATVFNATQISAIKKAAAVADECEKVLK